MDKVFYNSALKMEVATLPTLWHIYVSPVSLDPIVQCWLILLVVIEGEVRKGGTQWEMHLGLQ